MGMAASQARFLGLTARKSNNEYEAQQINQKRLDLASQQEGIVKRYNEKMNNRMFFYLRDPDLSTLNKQLTYWDIVNQIDNEENPGMGYRLTDANGNIIVPNYPAVDLTDPEIAAVVNKYNVVEEIKDNTILQENLEKGTWTLKAKRTDDDGNEHWFEIPFDEATFIEKMRAENPKDETDKEYWRLFNTLAPKVDGKYQELSYENLTTIKNLEIRVYDAEGKIVVPELPEDDKTIVYGQYQVDGYCVDPTYLEEKLRQGEWFIQTPKIGSTGYVEEWNTVPWQGLPNIQDSYNSEDDAAAEAEYEYMTSKFQKQDKMLELRLQQLETEHKAIETELDSVSKVLKDNIENSFKTFA